MTQRTFGELAYAPRKRKWLLTTDETHIVIRLKQIFPRIPKLQVETFEFPDDDFHCMELEWFMLRYPLRMSAADRRRLLGGKRKYQERQAHLEAIVQPDWLAPAYVGINEGQQVRHYQAQAVETVLSRHSLLLGDDVGLGKTYAAIALALQAETLPMAVVVEAHLQRQWADKIAAFCNLECHCVAKTTPYELPNAPIVIFRYSNIAGWVTEFAKGRFKSVVYDEIQNLRTGSSTNKGVAAQILSKNSVYQLGLSATPIFNLGAEIYSVVAFLPGKDVQHPLGTRGEFANEWLASGSDRIADPDALGMHLRERHVFMRRTKGDVGQEMDNVTAIYSEVPYDEGEEKRVEDVARTLAIRALTGSFVERGSAARELNMLMRHTTGVAKARGVAQFVRMILETGEKVLLAGWHRDFWKVVETELAEFKPCFYTGTESPAQKTKSVKAFTDGDSQVMFISLRSGSGLDGIQKVCSTAVLGEFDWSPQVHKQVVGRLDREGQTRPVTAFFLSVNCGSDPAIVELLGLKASQIRGVIDPNQPFRPVEVDDSKLRHLARDYLRRHGIALPKDAAADEDPPPAATAAAGDAPPSDPAAVEDAEWSVEEARIRASAAR